MAFESRRVGLLELFKLYLKGFVPRFAAGSLEWSRLFLQLESLLGAVLERGTPPPPKKKCGFPWIVPLKQPQEGVRSNKYRPT